MNEMNGMANEYITLMDEDNVEHQFELEAILDVGDHKYAVLIPLSEEYSESEEAIIMRFDTDEEGEEILYDIESDEEWDKVAEAYDNMIED